RPPRSPQRAAHRLGADLDGPAAEALPELIDGLVRRERRGIDVKVAAIDLAVGEEPRALPLVAGQAQERRLLPAPGRNSSGAGHDGRPLHEAEDTLRPLPCLSHRAEEFRQLALASPRAQYRACSSRCLDSTTEKELWMPLFSFEGKAPRIHPTAFIAPTASII